MLSLKKIFIGTAVVGVTVSVCVVGIRRFINKRRIMTSKQPTRLWNAQQRQKYVSQQEIGPKKLDSNLPKLSRKDKKKLKKQKENDRKKSAASKMEGTGLVHLKRRFHPEV